MKNIDKLKQIFDDQGLGLQLSFTDEENWKILFRICASELYSEKKKQTYLNNLKALDQSDLGKEWTLAIEGLTSNEEKLDGFWKEIHSKERTLSHQKLCYLLIGFNSEFSKYYRKQIYAEDYFKKLPDVLNNDTKQIGSIVLEEGLPVVLSNEKLIEKLRGVLPLIKHELQFHLRNIHK